MAHRYKMGQKVRVDFPGTVLHDLITTVVEIRSNSRWAYRLDLGKVWQHDRGIWFKAKELREVKNGH